MVFIKIYHKIIILQQKVTDNIYADAVPISTVSKFANVNAITIQQQRQQQQKQQQQQQNVAPSVSSFTCGSPIHNDDDINGFMVNFDKMVKAKATEQGFLEAQSSAKTTQQQQQQQSAPLYHIINDDIGRFVVNFDKMVKAKGLELTSIAQASPQKKKRHQAF